MDAWSDLLATSGALSASAALELQERGFIVIPGPVHSNRLDLLVDAYTVVMASAHGDDLRVGSTSTKVSDLVNRGAAFDDVYVFPPLLEACCLVIGGPFKLSSLHARTLRPQTRAQELHVDVPRDSGDWPLLGFILMIDAFRPDNGATRFVPGSQRWSMSPAETLSDQRAPYGGEALACGETGSLLVFNGSTWHGHTPNTSNAPRRSIQGAFIPRGGRAAIDFGGRMRSDTYERLRPLARQVLAI
jgi:hypothetical protein